MKRRNILYPVGILLLAALLVLGLYSVRYNDNLFRFALLAAAIAMVPAILWLRRTMLANILLVMLALSLAFDAVDTALYAMTATTKSIIADAEETAFYLRDPVLGYRQQPGVRARARETNGARVVYDVTYSTDEHGFRRTGGSAAKDAPTIVFLGDSFTFGEGLADADALPERFSAAQHGRDRVVNAGVSGYGTHQVLRMIETGTLDPLLGSGRRVFIYSAIADHLGRIAGGSPWDLYGPAYRLDHDAPRLAGPFHSGLGGKVLGFALHSSVLAMALEIRAREPRPDIARLYGAMVAEAHRLVLERYRGEFVVVLWDVPLQWNLANPERLARDAEMVQAMATEMTARNVPFLRISSLVPDYRANIVQYAIAGDGHPTALLNQRLADRLAERF